MTTMINLTAHAITILGPDGVTVTIPPSGQVARVSATATVVAETVVDGARVPIVRTAFGEVTGLPAPQDGVLYVTSTLVAQAAAAAERTDVVAPDTGPSAVRDAAGQVQAVRQLQTFAARVNA